MTRTSKTRWALLGQLSAEPASGYQLKKKIEESTAHFWSESYGQIYPELARMEEAGLLSSAEEVGEGQGPGVRRVYAITEQGMDELKRWLCEPPTEDVLRDEFLLKMFFGAHLDRETALAHVDRKIAQLEMYSVLLTAKARWILDSCPHDTVYPPFYIFAIRYGVAYTEGVMAQLQALRAAIANDTLLESHRSWLAGRPALDRETMERMTAAFQPGTEPDK